MAIESIPEREIFKRIRYENPWWGDQKSIDPYKKAMRPRAYIGLLIDLLNKRDLQRAVVLMGGRRVGKTWLLHHVIQHFIDQGTPPQKLCYISIESPVYTGSTLDGLLSGYTRCVGEESLAGATVIFDEIQYLKNWEIHLKKLVEDHPEVKFVASGSAAAALRLKSLESGAGRFTDFILPPLTFYEYLDLCGKGELVSSAAEGAPLKFACPEIEKLNEEFLKYLNYGAYPEAIFSPDIQADPQRFIRSDIIDKVLLRDIPQLYGIEDIQELNRLFTTLVYNTSNEVSLDALSHGSGVAKNTIKKYLIYLEAAFLIVILHRVDQAGKKFKRANYFKVYLTNPSMRSCLFGPIDGAHEAMGQLTETAIVSQWSHSPTIGHELYYARWNGGEIDLVYDSGRAITWCVEVKWTNRFYENPEELKNIWPFVRKHKSLESSIRVTTIDKAGVKSFHSLPILFTPASLYCYTVGRNIISYRAMQGVLS